MQLMERVVLTKTGKGIRQGGNLSPLLLNLYLHHLLDRRWQRQHSDMALLRWADDLLVLCRTQEQAQQAYNDLKRQLLPIGMTLKGKAELAIHNLGVGDSAIWLGYRLSRDGGGLKATMTENAWQSLVLARNAGSQAWRVSVSPWLYAVALRVGQSDSGEVLRKIRTAPRNGAAPSPPQTTGGQQQGPGCLGSPFVTVYLSNPSPRLSLFWTACPDEVGS
jgi:hypothetical protein